MFNILFGQGRKKNSPPIRSVVFPLESSGCVYPASEASRVSAIKRREMADAAYASVMELIKALAERGNTCAVKKQWEIPDECVARLRSCGYKVEETGMTYYRISW